MAVDYGETLVPGCSQYPERFQHCIPTLGNLSLSFFGRNSPDKSLFVLNSLIYKWGHISIKWKYNGEWNIEGLKTSGIPEIFSLGKDLNN